MARTADDFLTEIAAKPDDDGLKAVFADWLLERGDVRGELMALQLKDHRSDEELSREALLLKANLRHWLPDEILINVVPASIVFEKGVFAAARVQVRSPSALTASLPHPAWGTVRRLSGAPLELIERCPVLEELTEVDEPTLTGLADREHRVGRLRTLGVVGHAESVLARAFESPSFERVEELRLGFTLVAREDAPLRSYEPQRLRWLFDSRLGRTVRRLVLHTGWIDLGAWLPEMDAADPSVAEIQLTPMPFEASNWFIRFTHGRRSVQLYPGSELNASYSEGQVREILATAPRGWFTEVSLPDHVAWTSVLKLPCFERATYRPSSS